MKKLSISLLSMIEAGEELWRDAMTSRLDVAQAIDNAPQFAFRVTETLLSETVFEVYRVDTGEVVERTGDSFAIPAIISRLTSAARADAVLDLVRR